MFGGLHWHQLITEHRDRLASVPDEASDAADRLRDAIAERVQKLFDTEQERPFYHYQREFFEEESNDELPSELVTHGPREGIEAYFAYDFREGSDAEFEIFEVTKYGEEWMRQKDAYRSALRTSVLWEPSIHASQWMMGMVESSSPELGVSFQPKETVKEVTLRQAALNLSDTRDPKCLQPGLIELAGIGEQYVDVVMFDFDLFVLRSESDELFIFVRRFIEIEEPPGSDLLPDCFASLVGGVRISQGFFIDLDWLLEDIPRECAKQVLGSGNQRLHLGTDLLVPPSDLQTTVAEVNLFDVLKPLIKEPADRDLGLLQVRDSTAQLESQFKRRAWWFSGVSLMMIVSLSIGMGLLVRSVQSSQAEARRTENFVAAVTHELRTPIAAVKMYGEMLRDGWIKSPEKQQDYLERIVRETGRLDALVDRVLQKRHLREISVSPIKGDLNAEIEPLIPDLKLTAGTYGDDVAFELADDLPPILHVPDGVRSALVNLVENARKYAPVEKDSNGRLIGEPILVQTRMEGRKVVMEVKDRGPGIPERERSRIFDAFYRIGDEKTRTTAGTGLGLHIVFLQTRAMRGSIQALSRPGGGTVFRLVFQIA
ncbi:MAG: signal transduction histidine kinase [Planctomycetota bacterium]